MDYIQTLIANVGFPIAVSMYLLIRIEQKLQGYLIVLMIYPIIYRLLNNTKKTLVNLI